MAVHKHVNSLHEYGYPVWSGRSGYSLESADAAGILSPWEFQENENVQVYTETGSTMDIARDAAEKQPRENITVVAEKQTDGRRRDGGRWMSLSGGIWTTRILHAGGSAHRVTRFTLAAAAALASVLRSGFEIDARLRWPGDVLADGLKIAGAMSEAHIVGERLNWIALGMGINANNDVYPGDAVSLKKLTGKTTDRTQLLRSWTSALDAMQVSGDIESDDVPAWWNQWMAGIGQEAEFQVFGQHISGRQVGGRHIKGRVEGVDGLGRLRLKTPSEGNITLAAGDIEEKFNAG